MSLLDPAPNGNGDGINKAEPLFACHSGPDNQFFDLTLSAGVLQILGRNN